MKKYLKIFIFQAVGYSILLFWISCTFYVLGLYNPKFIKWLTLGVSSKLAPISQWIHSEVIMSIGAGFGMALILTISEVIKEKKGGKKK